MAEIEVHPLDWQQYGSSTVREFAGRPPLRYIVTSFPFGASLMLSGTYIQPDGDRYWPDADAAKSAAQMDLEERVAEVARAVSDD